MPPPWTNEEDEKLLLLVVNGLYQGNSCRESIEDASMEFENRSYLACYNRWNNVLKHKTSEHFLPTKEKREENFMDLILKLYKENYQLNMRVANIERKLEKFLKNENGKKEIKSIGFKF